MRPVLFIIGVFGFAYTSWAYLANATGSEVSILASIAFSFYTFGRRFYAPAGVFSEHAIYEITVAFFLVIFLAMILMGVFGKGEKK